MKQSADEGLFEVLHLSGGADVPRQNSGKVGAQKLFLQLVRVSLVLEMLEELVR